MSQQLHITLLWGLPGCGKTTYAQSLCGGDDKKPTTYMQAFCHSNYSRVDLDNIRSKDGTLKLQTIVDTVLSKFTQGRGMGYSKKCDHVILDGLCTTNAQADTLLSALQEAIAPSCGGLHFHIEWWSPDRDSCIWNDQYRRDVSSEVTIKNLPFEEPCGTLLEKFNIKSKNVVHRKVKRKTIACKWAEDKGLQDTEVLKSETWCLGGRTWDCEGKDTGRLSSEPQPEDFVAFDTLLEKAYPTLTFFQYKRIRKACVTIERQEIRDYYASGEEAYYKCDLKKLHEALVSEGLEKDDTRM